MKGLGWKEPCVFRETHPQMGLGGRREVGWGQSVQDPGAGC